MSVEFRHAIPILRSFSEEKAKDFYVVYLGFKVDWEHRFEPGFPLYMQVSRGDLVLHLSEHYGDGTPGTVLYLPMKGVPAYHAELHTRPGHGANPGLNDGMRGGKCLDLTDPFGNRLRFDEDRD